MDLDKEEFSSRPLPPHVRKDIMIVSKLRGAGGRDDEEEELIENSPISFRAQDAENSKFTVVLTRVQKKRLRKSQQK